MTDEWDDWIRDWTMVLEGDPDISPETVPPYRRNTTQFVDWLRDHHPSVTAPGLAERSHVEGWKGHLHLAGKRPATIRRALMALKSWFRWMAAEPGSGVSKPLPTDDVRAPAVPIEPVPVVGDDALRALLATCGNGEFIDLRDAAIIRMLLSLGLRRAELVSIDVADADLKTGDVYVMGKGRKPRIVSLSGTKTTLAMSRYLRLRKRHPAAAHPALFLVVRQSDRLDWRMTGQAVEMMLKRRCARAGIPTIHPHQLRHDWAHNAKSRGLSDEDLERMAGWSPGSVMSRRYGASLAGERARDAHRRLGLGDRI